MAGADLFVQGMAGNQVKRWYRPCHLQVSKVLSASFWGLPYRNLNNVDIAIINHPFLMVYTTHLWWLGGWFIIAIPTLIYRVVGKLGSFNWLSHHEASWGIENMEWYGYNMIQPYSSASRSLHRRVMIQTEPVTHSQKLDPKYQVDLAPQKKAYVAPCQNLVPQ